MKPGRSKPYAPRSGGRAFTLVELLAALAVLSLLTVALLSTLTSLSVVWQQGEGRIETRQSGRAIIDYISRELKAAALPTDRSDANSLQFVVNPDSTAEVATSFGNATYPTASTFYNPQALFWQVPVKKPAPGVVGGPLSDVMAEVGYFVSWDKTTNPSNPRATLCRFFVPPYTSTGTANPNYKIQPVSGSTQNFNPSGWLSDSILQAVAPANQTGQYQGWFADNVVALWARCLDPNGDTIITTAVQTASGATGKAYSAPYAYDSRQGYSYVPSGGTLEMKNGFYNPQTSSAQVLATLPASVEVAVVILSSRGANLLKTVPAYNVTSPSSGSNPFWSDIDAFVASLPTAVRAEASVYSARVPLETAQ